MRETACNINLISLKKAKNSNSAIKTGINGQSQDLSILYLTVVQSHKKVDETKISQNP